MFQVVSRLPKTLAWPRSMSTPILSRDLEYGTDTDRRTSFRGEINDG